MINSKAKGKRGERYVAKYCRDNYNLPDARRGVQYCGLKGNADVVDCFPDTHIECKFTERLNINKAMIQAVRDAGTQISVVAHKCNGGELMWTVRGCDLKRFAISVAGVIPE